MNEHASHNQSRTAQAAVFAFAGRNLTRWRFRYAVIALLSALFIMLSFAYSASLSAAAATRLQNTQQVQLAYFDALIERPFGAPTMSERVAQYTTRMRGFGTYITAWDEAAKVKVKSNKGTLELLGIPLVNRNMYAVPETEIRAGRLIENAGDIAIPHTIAENLSLQVGDSLDVLVLVQAIAHTKSFTIVGIFNDPSDYLPCLISFEDAKELLGTSEGNCYLVQQRPNFDDGMFVYYLGLFYPGSEILHKGKSIAMAESLQANVQSSSIWLLVLIFAFVGIAIFTVVYMTFLERRKEFATLKSIGMGAKQIIQLLGSEYGITETVGLVAGCLGMGVLFLLLPFFTVLTGTSLRNIVLYPLFGSMAMIILAASFPILSAIMGSVNQLNNARTIPLWTQHISEGPDNAFTRQRAENEGVLLLRIPEVNGVPDCLVLRSEGGHVKHGETIAVLESYGGLLVQEWVSPCDGTITSVNSGGFIAIRKDNG